MITGRVKQTLIGCAVVLSVSAVGAAMNYSRQQGALRVRQAAQIEEIEPGLAAPANEVPNVAQDDFGGSDGVLERQLRDYRVRPGADGSFTGRIGLADRVTGNIRGLSSVTIAFVQNGATVAEVQPAGDGTFRASLAPGVYSLVAEGPGGYAAYGLQVVDPQTEIRTVGLTKTKFQEVADTLEIDSLAIPPSDFETVYRLARSHIPPELLAAGAAPPPEPPADEPAEDLSGAAKATNVRAHAVRLQPDGGLIGRMQRLHPQTGRPLRVRRLNVFLVRDNAVVSQSPVSEAGFFRFGNVAPGTYSFVSAGPDGFAAFSVVTVDSNVAGPNVSDSLFLPVAARQGTFDLFGVAVPTSDLNRVLRNLAQLIGQPELADDAQFENPAEAAGGSLGPGGMSGVGGGAGAGGGFGAGAGGLFDALLPLALGGAIGALIAVAVDDDDKGDTIIISPSNPTSGSPSPVQPPFVRP